MKIAIYGNKRQERYLGELGGFFSMLAQNGMESMVSREFAGYLESHGVSLPGADVSVHRLHFLRRPHLRHLRRAPQAQRILLSCHLSGFGLEIG